MPDLNSKLTLDEVKLLKLLYKHYHFIPTMKRKYRHITAKILLCIPTLFVLYVFDFSVLPKVTVFDEIVSIRKMHIDEGSNFNIGKAYDAYNVKTKSSNKFVIKDTAIEDKLVTIKKSLIFRNITDIESDERNYTPYIATGYMSASFFFLALLTVSALVSLYLLKYSKKLTENSFQHILLVNSLIILYSVYVCAIIN